MSWSADSKSDGGRVPSCTIFLILDDVTHAEFNELFYKNTLLVHFLIGNKDWTLDGIFFILCC